MNSTYPPLSEGRREGTLLLQLPTSGPVPNNQNTSGSGRWIKAWILFDFEYFDKDNKDDSERMTWPELEGDRDRQDQARFHIRNSTSFVFNFRPLFSYFNNLNNKNN